MPKKKSNAEQTRFNRKKKYGGFLPDEIRHWNAMD